MLTRLSLSVPIVAFVLDLLTRVLLPVPMVGWGIYQHWHHADFDSTIPAITAIDLDMNPTFGRQISPLLTVQSI